jgi:hypothetical protein
MFHSNSHSSRCATPSLIGRPSSHSPIDAISHPSSTNTPSLLLNNNNSRPHSRLSCNSVSVCPDENGDKFGSRSSHSSTQKLLKKRFLGVVDPPIHNSQYHQQTTEMDDGNLHAGTDERHRLKSIGASLVSSNANSRKSTNVCKPHHVRMDSFASSIDSSIDFSSPRFDCEVGKKENNLSRFRGDLVASPCSAFDDLSLGSHNSSKSMSKQQQLQLGQHNRHKRVSSWRSSGSETAVTTFSGGFYFDGGSGSGMVVEQTCSPRRASYLNSSSTGPRLINAEAKRSVAKKR